MIVLFVENKYKTKLYEKLSNELVKEKIDCHFLIQNRLFETTFSNHHIGDLPYEESNVVEDLYRGCYDAIRSSDRGVNYFNKDDCHYKGYFYSIYKALVTIRPDVVYGESTLFHELMTIYICRHLSIPYFHPSGCRMPGGRFSFYKWDTLEPTLNKRYHSSREEINDFVESYGYRKKKLDYMKKLPKNGSITIDVKKWENWLYGAWSGFFYDKFNTPSLWRKMQLSFQLKNNITLWERQSKLYIDSSKKSILYPLHMQPECNVDVWSRDYRDQLKTIITISKQAPKDWIIYVKPNPKSKYEMSKELVEKCNNMGNVVLLSHNLTMGEIENEIDLFITASGTVAYECYLNSKPCISLSLPFFNEYSPERHLDSINNINFDDTLDNITNTKVSGELLLNYLMSTSYKGIIGDPISLSDCINPQNIEELKVAFLDNIKKECS